jgi:type I restriction enzyme S subunit
MTSRAGTDLKGCSAAGPIRGEGRKGRNILSRYPEYKDIGVPWIGQIPAQWDVLPLLGIAKERRESNVGMKEDNLLSLSYGNIVRKDSSSNDGLLPESYETYQIVHAGDVVFRLTDLQNDKRSL